MVMIGVVSGCGMLLGGDVVSGGVIDVNVISGTLVGGVII